MEFSQAKIGDIPTFELAENFKNDLDVMMSCCESELNSFKENQYQLAPAPFYFDRTTILLSKAKRWSEAIEAAEKYLAALDIYKKQAGNHHAKVWSSPTVIKIRSRLAKAYLKLEAEKTK